MKFFNKDEPYYALYEEWYNSVDDIETIAIPFEPFTFIQDLNEEWYFIPKRLMRYFLACLSVKSMINREKYVGSMSDNFETSFEFYHINYNPFT